MKKITIVLMAIAGLIGASTAFAGSNGWYVWGAAGQPTNYDDKKETDRALTSGGSTGFFSSYSKPTVYKLQIGNQLNEYFAVEGGYNGSNNATYTATGGNLARPISVSSDVSGWNLTAVGILPIAKQFSLLGKLGVADMRTSGTVVESGAIVSASGSKTEPTFGLAVKYDSTNNIFLRFDLDSYRTGSSTSSSRFTVWTIGVGRKF